MNKKNTTYWSLSRAAKETGKSKSVIHAALKNGVVSYVEKEGHRLTIHEEQAEDYAESKLKYIDNKPLPFIYESTGVLLTLNMTKKCMS